MAWNDDKNRHVIVSHGANARPSTDLNIELPEVVGQFVIPQIGFHMKDKKDIPKQNSDREKYMELLIKSIQEHLENTNSRKIELKLKFSLTEEEKNILKKLFPNIKFSSDNKEIYIERSKQSDNGNKSNTNVHILEKNEMKNMITIIVKNAGVKLKPNIRLTKEQYADLNKLFMGNLYAYKDKDGSVVFVLKDPSNRSYNQDVYDSIFGEVEKKKPEVKKPKSDITKPKTPKASKTAKGERKQEVSKPSKRERKPSKQRYKREKHGEEDILTYITTEIAKIFDEIERRLIDSADTISDIPEEVSETINSKKSKTPKPSKPRIQKPSKPTTKRKSKKSTETPTSTITLNLNNRKIEFYPIDIEDAIQGDIKITDKNAPLYGFIVPIKFAGRVKHPRCEGAEVDSYYFDKDTSLIMQAFGWKVINIEKHGSRIHVKMMPETETSDSIGYYPIRRKMLFYIKSMKLKKQMYGYDINGKSEKLSPGEYNAKVVKKNLILKPKNASWNDTEKIVIIPKTLMKSSLLFKERY